MREKIVELASQGLRASAISRHLKVSNGCVSKILTRYYQSGVIQPKAVGGSRPRMSTPQVVARIAQLKQEQPSLFAWEIRRALQAEGLGGATSRMPSVSSINRILRGLQRGPPALPDPPALLGKPPLLGLPLLGLGCSSKGSLETPETPPAPPEGASGQRSVRRRALSKPQWEALEEEFQRGQYPGTAMREKLSTLTQLSSAAVRVWFSNRRARWRRETPKALHTKRTGSPPPPLPSCPLTHPESRWACLPACALGASWPWGLSSCVPAALGGAPVPPATASAASFYGQGRLLEEPFLSR